MSHFTLIKTKLRDKKHLIEALEFMGHDVQENQVLVINNPSHAEEHPEFHAEVAIGTDVGFRWNENRNSYELVAELDTWNLDVPVDRFVDKLTQQYAVRCLIASTKEEGYEIEEQKVTDDGSVELVCTRWN